MLKMISNTTNHDQQTLRKQYQKEYEDTVKEHGIQPKPAGAYVLVKPCKAEDKSAGGIIIQVDDDDHLAMRIGMVISFGPTALVGYELPYRGITRGPEDYGIKTGDFVEYPIHCGRPCGYKQFSDYRVFPASDIMSVYSEVQS